MVKELCELQNYLSKVSLLARNFGHWRGYSVQVNESTEKTKPLYVTLKTDTEKSDKLLNEIEELGQTLAKKVREYEEEITFQLKTAPESDAVGD